MKHSAKGLVAALEKQEQQEHQPPPYTYAPSHGHGHASSSSAPPLPQADIMSGPGYSPHPIKSFNIINAGFWTHKNLVLTLNGQAILWVNSKSTAMGWGAPEVRLCTDPQGMQVVAAAKTKVSLTMVLNEKKGVILMMC